MDIRDNMIQTKNKNDFKIRLEAEIEIAKRNMLTYNNRRSKFFKSPRRTTLPGFIPVSGDKILSDENWVQLVALHTFVEREKWLNDDEIKHLLALNKEEFSFLNDVVESLPDAIDDLRIHGAMYIAMAYKQRKYIDTRMNEITSREKEFYKDDEQDINVAK